MLNSVDRIEVSQLLQFDGSTGAASPADRFALSGCFIGGYPGRVSVDCGSAVRALWPWDLDKERHRLASCEKTVGVAWNGTEWAPVAFRCGSRMCAVDFAAKGGRAVHRYGPLLEAALSEGYRCWHLTLTQRSERMWGSAVLPEEADRWLGIIPSRAGVVPPLQAVAGECAFLAYDRWRASWRDLRQHFTIRAMERDGAVGFLRGVEWTLRSKRGGRQQLPRWHCHGHVLAIAEPADWTPRPYLALWSRLAGVVDDRGRWTEGKGRGHEVMWKHGKTARGQDFMQYGGQYASRVNDREALLEILKYPFKPSEMTVAGQVDAWSALRGSRTHQPAGALWPTSNAAQRDPWRRWLELEPPETPWAVLEWRPVREAGSDELAHRWELATGNTLPDDAEPVELRIRIGTDEREEAVYSTWRADPRGYAAIARAHPLCSIDPPDADPDPGVDAGAWLDAV